MERHTEESFQKTGKVWFGRLAGSAVLTKRRDFLRWALHILPLAIRAWRTISDYKLLFSSAIWTFHFDGAHCGNVYWYQDRVIFLDWQKVSWRNDPTFTLVRFATSTGVKGEVDDYVMEVLIRAYLEVREVQDFWTMARVRLLERQVSDLIWVLWDAARRKDPRPVEEAASVVGRSLEVQKLLRKY